MAIEDGYSLYACDVQGCSASAYARAGTNVADGYVTRRRIDANGVERRALLCPEHAKAYAALVAACDGLYGELMATGSATVVTGEQLDAAQRAARESEDARKWWGDRYRALEAEYKAYREAHPDGTGGAAPAGAEGGGA